MMGDNSSPRSTLVGLRVCDFEPWVGASCCTSNLTQEMEIQSNRLSCWTPSTETRTSLPPLSNNRESEVGLAGRQLLNFTITAPARNLFPSRNFSVLLYIRGHSHYSTFDSWSYGTDGNMDSVMERIIRWDSHLRKSSVSLPELRSWHRTVDGSHDN